MSETVEHVRECAIQWLLRIEDEPESREIQQKLECWLDEDANHRRIYHQISLIWTATGTESPNRLSAKATTCLMLLLNVLLFWTLQQPDVSTRIGQMATIRLPGGAELTLAPGSAINIRPDRRAHSIELVSGAVYAEVDAARLNKPFVIRSRTGEVQALGTRFSVQWEQEGARVDVYESRVQLTPSDRKTQGQVLAAGHSAILHTFGVEPLALPTYERPDWLTGELVFLHSPLRNVLAALQRHDTRRQWLQLSKSDLDTPFSGVLRVTDLDAAYTLLAQSMGLSVDNPGLDIRRIKKN
ncbi:FecR family protein [Marinobacterium marinum]|uniref:FecR domain-containing protein n=1 Tax=Marinobacterium marinum TaxID=2756129 RepID=A0A7W1WX97_9GAMM|nr:FecR domain-containing protein [Marinobacterium marinum]MBA4501756.1 FecR domain-containing protein [Marinobacterium marinum]